MAAYESNVTLNEAARRLASARSVLVTSHAKPDGDAFGAVMAVTAARRAAGRDVTGCLLGPVAAYLRELRGFEGLIALDEGAPLPADALAKADLVMVVDTGAWSQLAVARPQLEAAVDRMLIVDHHLSGDVPAAWRYIDPSVGSCCELIAPLLDAGGLYPAPRAEQGPSMGAVVDDAIYAGIASDTGWFKYSNTRPQTHELAARLLGRGVDGAGIFRRMEQTERPAKLALMGRALTSMEMLAGGRAAMLVLRREDFEQTGAYAEETERLVDLPQLIASVQLVVLVSQPPVGGSGAAPVVRLSFRSKPGEHAVNVSQLAGQFGGGGHARAAGAKVQGTLEEAVERVRAAVNAAMTSL